jgi:hypothetical protein
LAPLQPYNPKVWFGLQQLQADEVCCSNAWVVWDTTTLTTFGKAALCFEIHTPEEEAYQIIANFLHIPAYAHTTHRGLLEYIVFEAATTVLLYYTRDIPAEVS